MPYVLYHNGGKVVALDEDGPHLIITDWDPQTQQDVLWALVELPPNGIEVLASSGPAAAAEAPAAAYSVAPDAEVRDLRKPRVHPSQRLAWSHTRAS
jgi:hypothetical protein